MRIKMFSFQSPLGELGVPKRGIVPPFEAHRERSELLQLSQKLRVPKEVFGV